MKKFLLLLIIVVFNGFYSFSQSAPPEGINYQAIARTASGGVLSSAPLTVQFFVRDGSATGPAVYQETHSTTTNVYGLFTLVIGQGTQVGVNTFATIPWATGSKFLEVQVDDGSGYISMGTTQMMSVPYALYAKV